MKGVTVEQLRQYLRYEPETGNFYWIAEPNSRGPRVTGKIAGGRNSFGHWQIRLFKRFYYSHRLAWLFMHGTEPKEIDHRNGIPWDNRISNLRECTHQRNLLNSDQLNRGVQKHGRRYRARVGARDKRITIGTYDTIAEAQEAYNAYVTQVHGDFARVNRDAEQH
jgi:hypothetical protein